MKNTLIAGVVLGALVGGNAMAADMFVKAPPAPVYNWTGCYLGAGGGYGMWNQDSFLETSPALVQITTTQTNSGRGWFGTVGGGCDYQVNSNIVIGALADGDWGSVKGTYSDGENLFSQGSETMQSAWYVGGRVGWLVTPTVLTYWEGGYTQAHFSEIDLFTSGIPSFPEGRDIAAHTYSGWFLGGGFDYALPILSGLFLRTDYRYSTYGAADLPEIITATGVPTTTAVNSQKYVQTVRSELIFQFNWGH